MTLATVSDVHVLPQASMPLSKEQLSRSLCGVEFFHIYTDETISERHTLGLELLRQAELNWDFEYSRIVLVDNYNPTVHHIAIDDVLRYLRGENMLPDYWAYEGDMVDNAKLLLNAIVDKKLQKNYRRYIDQHGKYPCSLLTATWYLTRLGCLDPAGVIRTVEGEEAYRPVTRLLNVLPQDYASVEARARQIITKSLFSAAADSIEDLLFDLDAGRTVDLF